ncbi:MAG: FkbM family methyltransferase [Coleofasciculus sp. B1-GNL1-01]|uniref:FkbM family methyltransferase n=1 Tax=Coleofasciculus sp. B1-GNL1-01 TaxID=3068484 RepID=UPI0032F80F9F
MKTIFHRLGRKIYKTQTRYLPVGLDLVADINKIYPNLGQIKTIFDVGANIGQTARHFYKSFPNANILSFEPIKETFDELHYNTEKLNRVSCFNHALGNINESRKIYLKEKSNLNSLVEDIMPISENYDIVNVKTIDEFCENNDIENIDILKTDTEGWDLNVIQGAIAALNRSQQI